MSLTEMSFECTSPCSFSKLSFKLKTVMIFVVVKGWSTGLVDMQNVHFNV